MKLVLFAQYVRHVPGKDARDASHYASCDQELLLAATEAHVVRSNVEVTDGQ